jgi:Spy/CpxP family protein refolding chaperone
MKKSLHLFLAVMAVLVLVLASCAPATPAATEPPATQAPTEVVPSN